VRWIAIGVVAAGLLLTPAAAAKHTGQKEMIEESNRLEVRALNLYKDNRDDPEIEQLITRSMELLEQVGVLDPRNPSQGPDHELDSAIGADQRFLGQRATIPNAAVRYLTLAILLKDDALDQLRTLPWRYQPQRDKAAKPTGISPPKCARSLAAIAPAGCWHADSWDINVDANAKRARCTFTEPQGLLRPDQPLFPGTYQQTSCVLTNSFRTVDGVRKRIVHAELRITTPVDAHPSGSKTVIVRAHWQ
jgi:hypothetical protein